MSSSEQQQIARILGDIDSDVIGRVLANKDTQTRDLTALTRLAETCRTHVTTTLEANTPRGTILEVEDQGAQQLGLPTISTILSEYDALRKIRDDFIRSIALRTDDVLRLQRGEYVATPAGTAVSMSHTTLTPPGEVTTRIVTGNGSGIEREFRERLAMLQYILYDLGLDPNDPEQVQITVGPVLDSMMREVTYVSVFIPRLSRVVEICNEVENRSFVWNTKDPSDVSRFGAMTKEQKQERLRAHQGTGADVIMAQGWEGRMRELLLAGAVPAIPTGQRIVRTMLVAKDEETKWNEKVVELKAFRAEHPTKWPLMQSKGLGTWLRAQRENMRDNKLAQNRVVILRELGVEPAQKGTPKQTFETWVKQLREFRTEKPDEWPKANEKGLGQWLRIQREQMRDETLAPERATVLRELGVEASQKCTPKKTFDEWMVELRQYLNDNEGELPNTDMKGLGAWLWMQSQKLREGTLESTQAMLLTELGVTPAERILSFEERMGQLRTFVANHQRLPSCNIQVEKQLYDWLTRCRHKMHEGTLGSEHAEELKALGVTPLAKKKKSKKSETASEEIEEEEV